MSEPQNLGPPGQEADFDPFSSALPVELRSTPAQMEMWLSQQAGHAAGCAYNESFSVRLRGVIDDEALDRALRLLPDLHEALRGHFSADGQRFIIDPVIDVQVAQHDLTGLSAAARETEAAHLAGLDGTTPYDLEKGPLFRASIIRLGEQDRLVLLGAHHAACDGWSLDVLLADFGRLYSAFSGGAPLPAPPRHGFGDYVAYHFAPENGARLEASREFWRTALKVLPPPLSLPFDGRRPAERSFGARHASLGLPAEALAAAKALARAQHVSLFSVLMAAYGTLLHRLSGATDLVVGIPVAGHPEAGMEDCVGHLVNFVPVRFDFSSPMTFAECCRKISTAVLDAREHAFISFGEIVRELKVPRDPARVPLVAATFTHVQKYAPGKLVFANAEVDYHLNARSFETFELTLNAVEAHDGLLLKAYANADLYSQDWLSWRLRELASVLRHGCEMPNTLVASLTLVPPDEVATLTEKFNATTIDFPRDASLATLVELQCARAGDNIAIRCGEVALTYAELEGRANQLARALRARGVGRGKLVGICLERTPDMVVAVLAISKAGAGYIPLDPAFPVERVAYMVESSQLAMVVSQSNLGAIHGCAPERTLEIDTERAAVGTLPKTPLERDAQSAQPEDVAYVLYTSGSTGKPKGVAVHHRAAVNFLNSMAKTPGLGPDDRLLAVTTLSFDIALLELMLPLIVGAQIVLASREQVLDGAALLGLLARHDVTVMQATPATWRLLIASGWTGHARFRALCGGEAMPPELAEALLGRVMELWNMYGPTETTVWSTCGRVTRPAGGITVGRPIDNTVIRILDGDMRLVPIGIPGEIYIGGEGVALGYLHRPDLTSERFVSDPFAAGARLYKTGDLGRWRGDGELDVLGRADFQVKVRGYRIELGEIEAVLVAHPSVKQAVVVPREHRPGDVRLVAYLQTNDAVADEKELRAHLRRALPEYMVPQHFMTVASFPTTPNGKIDRKALPAPEAGPAAAPSAGPRTPTQERILTIWRELLKRDGLAIDDDFFDVGGHSLLCVMLIAEIKKELGVQLPFSQVLRSPTIAGLAEVVDAEKAPASEPATAEASDLVVLRRGGSEKVFFVFDGFGEILPYLNLARRLPPRFDVYGVLPPRLPGVPLASTSVRDMARHCVEQIRQKQPEGPYTIGGLCAGGVVAFACAEQLEEQQAEVAELILLDAVAPTTRQRPWRIAGQRWQRFRAGLLQSWSSPPALGAAESDLSAAAGYGGVPVQVAGTALGKVRALIGYEARNQLANLSASVRFRVLEYMLANKLAWPPWLPPLEVADIYANARERYRPGRVRAPIVLVRAGDGDDVASEMVLDPLLGWADRSSQPLRVIDAPGGHSSMLQEPNVAFIAEELVKHLERDDPRLPSRAGLTQSSL
ncbi:MAG TPA: amino acid adenylation domain-containing protein [Polyangia bacterium]